MSRPERTNIATLIVAILAAYAAYLSLDKTARGEFMVAFVLVVNILAIGLLIIAIARNLRDAHRAKGKQAVIESLNAECELQKAAATRRLKALDAAAYDLQTAGQLIMLAEDALHISDQLAQILSENATEPKALDLTHPLSRVITSLEMGKTEVLPWQQL